jgi:amino acid permease
MTRKLSILEATSIIVGAGVGGGVMAVPFLVSRSGIPAFLMVIVTAAILNIGINMLLADVAIRDGRHLQILELMRDYVFRSRTGAAFSWIFFILLGVSFIASLTAYIDGAGRVLADLAGWSVMPTQLGVYALSAGIVFLGLKSVGVSETLGLALLLGFCLIIGLGSAQFRVNPWPVSPRPTEKSTEMLALFGIVMYSLNAAFAVPQAVKGLDGHRGKTTSAIVAGTVLNAVVVTVITFVALAVSNPVTKVAVIGISNAAGPLVSVSASLFVILAMLTTYWSVSLALADIVKQRTGLDTRSAWAIASLPTVLLILFGVFDFIQYLQIAGGIVALVVMFTTVPMFLRARKERIIRNPIVRLGPWLTGILLTVLTIGMLLMAVGSLIQ